MFLSRNAYTSLNNTCRYIQNNLGHLTGGLSYGISCKKLPPINIELCKDCLGIIKSEYPCKHVARTNVIKDSSITSSLSILSIHKCTFISM